MPEVTLPALIQQMLQPDFYPHGVQTPIQLLQTHISYVLLTGDYAYKVKKPVNFGFLDFSCPKRRQHYCQEELRLNARWAPDLYLEVLPISEHPAGRYRLGASNGHPVVEHALKMRQFPQESLFSHLFEAGQLTATDLEALGRQTAAFHQQADHSDEIRQFGSLTMIRRTLDGNYQASLPYIGRAQTQPQYEETRQFTDSFLVDHSRWFERRQREGKIRECHGDLHLGNVCRYQNQIRAFDCIEFNDEFRCIDVLYDAAFMVMDLEFRGRTDLAYAFLNTYLEYTCDYWGAVLLPFYCSVRAYVRAKVNSLILDDPGLTPSQLASAQEVAAAYYRQAWAYGRPRQGRLLVMSGHSGSGKSTVARHLAQTLGAIHIRSDAVRKHLAGIPLHQRGDDSLYTSEMTDLTYTQLQELGLFLASQGLTVILDARYDRQVQRQGILIQAAGRNLPVHILHCHAPLEVLAQRLDKRQGDIADATSDLLAHQLRALEPFTEQEQPLVIGVDTSGDWQAGLCREPLLALPPHCLA